MKRLVVACILLTLLLTGCGPRAAKPADTTAPTAGTPATTTATAPAGDAAAKALNLTADQVLYRAAFRGGSLGDRAFHGGEVLLWKSGEHKYSVGAALDMGGGTWRASTTRELTVNPDQRFAVSAVVLNDGDDKERAVPLNVFFGAVNHPRIETAEVAFPGVTILPAPVRGGVWLAVYQGVMAGGPDDQLEINGCDHGSHALYTETPTLQ